MNRFISVVSLVNLSTIVSLFTLAPKVTAQTANSGQVEMTATVTGLCLFENVFDGTLNELDGSLGVDPNDLATLDSAAAANGITALPGASGTIDLTCNNPAASINISSVQESNTVGATVNTFTTTVSGLSTEITSNDGAAGTAVAVGSSNMETLTVDLVATYNDNLAPGDYKFIINLEATP